MKKIALMIAAILVVCLMATACVKTPTDTPTSSEEQKTTSSQQQEATSSKQETTSSSTPAPVGGAVWQDFSAIANAQGKGTEFSAVEGIFTITRGKASTSSGKTVKEGTKAGTSFTGGVQVGKNGTAADKSIAFTVPAGCTTVEVYVNSASTGVDGDFYVSVNGVPSTYPCTNASITAVTISVSAGAQVAVYGSASVSTNVWGILVK